ncbi:predicted protein [Postia placenta Mad-698-R]|uniref:DUF6534 domain-containing protein n=1 Tax=Postia placenta MAD-698-R-SB12 TaxID=670580 RepID=A0A1X6N4L2_9APHY|nr:hypothetical protein POSPLADRAFT_1140232 [Postia placenta MAD-698-R-SB12]EED80647.1 predicted protein [Postia placenta Mad-698-R]OSX63373.1 hypothetical protein POSPLADRAFT_1140232 [Postia placenta MAD-698-R-SB12]
MPSDFDTSFGAMLLGVLMSSILFGITNLQVYIYFKTYTNDPLWIKFSVCALWIVDALCVAFSFHLIYQYLITDYTNPDALLIIDWSFKAQDILSTICISFVQTNQWMLQSIVIPAYAASYLVLLAFLRDYHARKCDSQWLARPSVAPGIDGGFQPDSIRSSEPVTPIDYGSFTRTDSLINTLMLYTVNTGIITSLCSLAAIIAMKTSPHTFIVAAVEFLLTKIYVNSFLAMLNARNSLRESDSRIKRDYVLDTLQRTMTSEVADDSKPNPLPPTIDIRSEIDSDSDGPRPSYTDIEFDKAVAQGYAPPTFPQGEGTEDVMISLSKEHDSSLRPLPTPPQAHVYAIQNTARSMLRYGQTLRESTNKLMIFSSCHRFMVTVYRTQDRQLPGFQ